MGVARYAWDFAQEARGVQMATHTHVQQLDSCACSSSVHCNRVEQTDEKLRRWQSTERRARRAKCLCAACTVLAGARGVFRVCNHVRMCLLWTLLMPHGHAMLLAALLSDTCRDRSPRQCEWTNCGLWRWGLSGG